MKLHGVSREWSRRRQLELREQVERDKLAETSRSFPLLFPFLSAPQGMRNFLDQGSNLGPMQATGEVPPLLLNLSPLPTLHSLPLTSFPVPSLGSPHTLHVSWLLWFSPPYLLFLPFCSFFAHTPRWAWNVLFQPTLLWGNPVPPSVRGSVGVSPSWTPPASLPNPQGL